MQKHNYLKNAVKIKWIFCSDIYILYVFFSFDGSGALISMTTLWFLAVHIKTSSLLIQTDVVSWAPCIFKKI